MSRMNENIWKHSLVVLLVMLVPSLLMAQHKTSAPSKPSAPSHSSAPSHASTPSHNTSSQHSTTQSHPSTNTNRPANNASRPSTNTNRPNTNAGRTNTNSNRPNNASRPNTNRPGNANTNRPGNAGGNRSASNRPAAGSHTAPGRTVSMHNGGTANVRPNGQVRSINRPGLSVHNNLHGGRTVVTTHNGARIVSVGHRGGYVQRAYVTRGGRAFVSRTYVYHGVVRVGVYRSFGWHGYCCYYGYYHPFFFGVGFYGWGWHPWAAPIAWGWGWGGAPWFGFYAGWWNPYPVYAAPYFWLTDWMIAANLQAAYAAQQEAAADAAGAAAAASDGQAADSGGGGGDGGGQVALSPEVKQAIADEVKAQIQAAQQDSQQSSGGGSAAPAPTSSSSASNSDTPPPALDPAHRTFIVSSDLDVVADGQECALSQGDVITRLTDTPDADQKVNVSVASSKRNDCAAGKTVLVSVDDLQEMNNQFQEKVDNGLKEMASKQGTGGMPKAPDATTKPSDVPPPAPDKTAADQLAQQQKEADQAESDAKADAGSSGGGYQ